VIDFRINKGNAAQSFMFKNQVYRPMGESTGSTPFLLLLAIMQPILFFTSLKFFGLNGTAFITAILILILILFIIWMWVSGKNPFASNEEE
jgi:amino acid transporter